MSRQTRLAIAAATMAAFVVRLLAADGGLWLDEAWSVVFARDAGTAIGVLRIGHDNNHVLNSWWLLLVGPSAPSVVMRGLSIMCGTAAIPVAAMIAARRGPLAAGLAAWLLALSPALVTYGSEARGYAPMLLALLVTIRLIARSIDRPGVPSPVIGIAIALGLGMFAQLTLLFALPALLGWSLWAFRTDRPIHRTAALLGPGLATAAGVAAITLAGGITVGSYQPFAITNWTNALGELARYTLAIGWLPKFALVMLVPGGAFAFAIARAEDGFAALVALAVLAFPIAVAVLGIGNSGLARYYLVAAAILLLALAQAPRVIALPVSVIVFAGSVLADLDLATNRRADPARAVAAMAKHYPRGAYYAVEVDRDAAVIEVAAAQAGYRALPATSPCPAPAFLFVTRDGDAPFPAEPARCGRRYLPIAGQRTTGLSGNHWQLYLRQP